MKEKIIPIGAILGFLSVLFGAFGTHALKGKIGFDLFDIFLTGTHYLTIHALAMILYGLWLRTLAKEEVKCWPAAAFLFGTFIFTGTLYGITFTGMRWLGAITPVGGVLMMVGWLGFAIQAWRHNRTVV